MNAQPLSSEIRAGVLYLTLDTPACRVNIFTQQAALQLLEALGAIGADVRAVVFRSAKPESFVNGASLMLCSAISKPEDLSRLTGTIRRAYQALDDLRIPTVAAMRGNCYGCGVELSLRCRYRIAGDSSDAHVYMPELADYLLVPTFGSTQKLPPLLGLEGATDFLLWGQRWSAREALERGLLHAAVPDGEFDLAVEHIATDLALHGSSALLRTPKRPPPIDVEAFGKRTRERIQWLPPDHREAYAACYALMEQAACREGGEPADYEAETLASGRSIMTAASKRATAFFFVRQLAEEVSLRGAPEPSTYRVGCDMSAPGPRFLREELERLRIRGATFADSQSAPASPELWRVVEYGGASDEAARSRTLAMSDALAFGPPRTQSDAVLYGPAWRRGVRFVEIAKLRPSEGAQTASRLLAKGGVKSVVTQPKREFVTNDVLGSFLAPQVAFVEAGGEPVDVAATLVALGFTRLPGDWLAGWDLDAVARLVGDPEASASRRGALAKTIAALPRARDSVEGRPSELLQNALLTSLLAFAHRTLREQSVNHASIVDVVARELIDFPLGHTSLCRHLTVERARALLGHESAMGALVRPPAANSLREYVESGRDFYR
jgi:enoyl-CoA hydratase/carnithine racemase